MTTRLKMARTTRERKAALREVLHRAADQIVDVLIEDLDDAEPAPIEVSSLRLPPDARNAASFNRACKRGLVKGARKVGRVWIATREAWDARARVTAPKLSDEAKEKARAKKLPRREPAAVEHPAVSDELLAEFGLARKKTA